MRIIFFFLLAMSQITVMAQPNPPQFSKLSGKITQRFSTIKAKNGYIYYDDPKIGSTYLTKVDNNGKKIKEIPFFDSTYVKGGYIFRQDNRNFFFGVKALRVSGSINDPSLILSFKTQRRCVIEFDDDLNIKSEVLSDTLPNGYGYMSNTGPLLGVNVFNCQSAKINGDTLIAIIYVFSVNVENFTTSRTIRYEKVNWKTGKMHSVSDISDYYGSYVTSVFTPEGFYSFGEVSFTKLQGGGLFNGVAVGKFNKEGKLLSTYQYDKFYSGEFLSGSFGTLFNDKLLCSYVGMYPSTAAEPCKIQTATLDLRDYDFNLIKRVKVPDCEMRPSGISPFALTSKNEIYLQTESTSRADIGIYKYDQNLNLIWSKKIPLSFHSPVTMTLTDDEGVILSCIEQGSSYNYLRIYKINATDGAVVSINEQALFTDNISINPNPFQDRFYIRLPEATSFQYTLTDMIGRTVKQQCVEATNFHEIDSSTLATGVYVLTIKTKDGKILARKIVKQ